MKAAQELNVTHSAISRQIRLLEEYLGVELFERRNRAVFLTANGQILLQTTSSIFEQLKNGVEKIKSSTFPDVVSLSCEPTIAMKWLIPRLTHFYQQYPHITVHLVAAGGVIDFTKANVDLALRRNDFKWNDNLFAVKVCSERMGVVVRPGLDLKKNFAHIPQLSTTSRPNAWTTWQNIKKLLFQIVKLLHMSTFTCAFKLHWRGKEQRLHHF